MEHQAQMALALALRRIDALEQDKRLGEEMTFPRVISMPPSKECVQLGQLSFFTVGVTTNLELVPDNFFWKCGNCQRKVRWRCECDTGQGMNGTARKQKRATR